MMLILGKTIINHLQIDKKENTNEAFRQTPFAQGKRKG